jgi:ankyrin repeat protein
MPPTDELFDAIRRGDRDEVRGRLEADPSLVDAEVDGVSAIRAAAYAGHADLADELISLGAEPDVFDAAAIGDVERVRALVDDEPGLAKDSAGDGFTALHLAAWFGHPKVAELLLGRGADPQAVAGNGTELQPLHSAAAGGHPVIAHLLLDRGADIDARQQGGVTPLHSAAHRGDTEMVALLLGRGADPSAATDDGKLAADLTDDPEVLALLP